LAGRDIREVDLRYAIRLRQTRSCAARQRAADAASRYARAMRHLKIDLTQHMSDLALSFWRGRSIDVWRLYVELTRLGWKVDTEESNLMAAMSRTWRAEGIKVWLRLESFVCAPPDGEVAPLDAIYFYRFDPAQMPATTMYAAIYEPGDEEKDWFASHREEWDWLVEHGDPQFDTSAILRPITLGEVPAQIRDELWMDLEAAIQFTDEA